MHKWIGAGLLVLLLGSALGPPRSAAQSGITHQVEPFLYHSALITALAFAPDGRLFFAERSGDVRLVSAAGELQAEPVIRFDVDTLGERGLIGLTLDPAYTENGYLYAYYTALDQGEFGYGIQQRLVRFTEDDGMGGEEVLLWELGIPAAADKGMHYGGNLRFGPDGLLYLALGDNSVAANAQDLTVQPGKIHRFAVEGDQLRPAEDNPWPGNSAYAIGLRNPIDLVFDPLSGALFATENGPLCDDEVNRIEVGANYGWRPRYGEDALCDNETPGLYPDYTAPLVYYTPTVAPVGITVYTGEQLPEFYGNLFFCAWKDGRMRRLVLDEQRQAVLFQESVDLRATQCTTDVEMGPDGALYYVSWTASRAGIYRLVGVEAP
ncbi:MAG: PQQ-dependent sugar dehydrogenase [Anaerolineae bacterium]|nr:PQQ-dependent sugar dehydrogenase [Anaerolineae bacterium]